MVIEAAYIPRALSTELLRQCEEFPVVTLLGPRQAGKTTLARHSLPHYGYVSLETPHLRAHASADPVAFLEAHPAPCIIDEIQRVPMLLSYIQGLVDEQGGSGHYVLTGSHHLALHEAVSQSLAGRTSILTLLPLSLHELRNAGLTPVDAATAIFTGFLPRVHSGPQRPTIAYSSYLRTYVERDVRQLIRLKDVSLFEKFLRLLAGRVGQLVDYHSLGGDVGVDGKTIAHWLSILEASFVAFRLPPYFENFGKRLVKTPKIYFTDTGLLCHLLGIETPTQVARDPLIGHLFENLVVIECLKARHHAAKDPNLYFFRDRHGLELDLLHATGRQLIGLEIKSASTYHPTLCAALERFHATVAPLARRTLVYSGEALHRSDDLDVIPYDAVAEFLLGE